MIPVGYPIESFSEQKKADFVYNDIEIRRMREYIIWSTHSKKIEFF